MQPKDKWKVGNELKALLAKFPHDRVLERMVHEEFKKNQLFLYPQEYDLYDQAMEHSLKKNFTMETGQFEPGGADRVWKVPDFSNEDKIIQEFKKRDMYDKKDFERHIKEQAKKEMALEKFLHEQAFKYQDYMKNRNQGGQRKTLRTILAEYYQDLIKAHGELAKKRFPHVAYG